MCKETLMFMPLNGCCPESVRHAIRPGISCLAGVSSFAAIASSPVTSGRCRGTSLHDLVASGLRAARRVTSARQDGNVQRTIDVDALERLLPEICAACHKARHLVLGRNKLRCDDWPLLRIVFTRPGCLRSVICQAGNLRPAGAGTLFNSECRKATRLFTQPK